MASWAAEDVARIAATDDFHIAAYHQDGITTGTLTWIWSVVVDGRVFVRAWNGTRSRWYRAAMAQGRGRITAGGNTYEVEYAPVSDEELNDRIDAAYSQKYAGNPYLPPMVAAGPKAATVEVSPRNNPA